MPIDTLPHQLAPSEHRTWCDPSVCTVDDTDPRNGIIHTHSVVLLDEPGLRVEAYELLIVGDEGVTASRDVTTTTTVATLDTMPAAQAGRLGLALLEASVILAA